MDTDQIVAGGIVALVVALVAMLVASIFFSASRTAECRTAAMAARYQATDIAVICNK
jgi:Mg2+/Co2+ transporter CorB